MTTAKSDTFFSRPADDPSPRPRKRPLIIDQDGNEVNDGFGARLGNAAFGRFPEGFDRTIFGGISFGSLTREQRLARLDALARLMDVAFVLPGTNVRYGIDGLIGLVPVVGDLLTTALSLWVVKEARALGAPAHIVLRMLGNVAVEGVLGMVPIVGDAFDVLFRANMRNVRILRSWMNKQPR
ncbi:MAG: DUF4112 domain-containing protein [Xanthobacteraceae bacterium]|nr:DUF4112 domain-containing protein [Xanthobacteraceae bacterium]